MRGRRPLIGLALLALVLGAGAAWLLGGREPDLEQAERRAKDEGSPERPVLVGTPRAAPLEKPVPGSPPSTKSDEAGARPGGQTRERLRLRVVDSRGAPVPFVIVGVTTTEGGRMARTGEDGTVVLALPAGELQRLEVEGRSGASNPLLALTKPEELARLADGDLVLPDLFDLVVRTVDGRGNLRPNERINFRPEGSRAYWGETSDEKGICRLGPFRIGLRMGLRPGPRGVEAERDPVDWRLVTVDWAPVDLVVGDAPRLRLRVSGAPPDELVRIAVLDPDGGEPLFPPDRTQDRIWMAPALAANRVEVLVGPTEDGRYARLRGVVATDEPLPADLKAGVPLTGRLDVAEAGAPLGGEVAAMGRGFEVRVAVSPEGRFRFPGLPDETVTLFAEASAGDGVRLQGRVVRTDGTEVVIPTTRRYRIAGRLALAGNPKGTINFQPHFEATSDSQPAVSNVGDPSDARFALFLPAGRWTLRVTGTTPGAVELSGELDLGEVSAPRDGLVILMKPLK